MTNKSDMGRGQAAYAMASLSAAFISTVVLCPLIGLGYAVLAAIRVDYSRIATDGFGVAGLAFLATPFAFPIFFAGALCMGSASHACLHALGASNRVAAAATAGLSAAAAWMLLGGGGPYGGAGLIAPVSIASAAGGLIFRHVAEKELRPPPVRPS